MNDEQILDLYFARDEQAVAETDRKYGGYCFTLANSILHSDQDAEETVSDTYLRAWNTIPPKRPGIFKMFLAKITRNLAFSRWRSMNAEKRGGGEMTLVLEELDDCIAAPGCVGDGMDAKELAKAIVEDAKPVAEPQITLTVSPEDYKLFQEIKAEEAEQQASASGSTAKEAKEIS